ncbi:hypothetical protein [Modestobacter sp. SSW1-42]|uniref:hypothetical protein n=1 Tax=Modestobacter sp. SSW1-42 TaxID=596372 RepID=UPI003986381D
MTGPEEQVAAVLRRHTATKLSPTCLTWHTGADCERQVALQQWAEQLRIARETASVFTVGTLLGHLAIEQGYCCEALDTAERKGLLKEVATAIPHHPAAALAVLHQLTARNPDAPFSQAWLRSGVRQALAIYQLLLCHPSLRSELRGVPLEVVFHSVSIEPIIAYPRCEAPRNRDIALVLTAMHVGLTGEEVLAARTDQSTDRTIATLAVLKDPSLAPWARHLMGPL